MLRTQRSLFSQSGSPGEEEERDEKFRAEWREKSRSPLASSTSVLLTVTGGGGLPSTLTSEQTEVPGDRGLGMPARQHTLPMGF